MKKILVLFLVFINFTLLTSLTFNKVGDFLIGGDYSGKYTLISDYPYLYALSCYGLDIYKYHTETDDIQRIITIPIEGEASSFIRKDNFIYISSLGGTSYYDATQSGIYKIDISQPENAYIVNTISFDKNIMINKLKLINNQPYYIKSVYNASTSSYSYNKIVYFNIENFEELSSIELSGALCYSFGEHFLAIKILSCNNDEYTESFHIYNLENPYEPFYQGDITLVTPNLEYGPLQKLDNNITIESSYQGITFFDSSDPLNWQIVSSLESEGGFQYGFLKWDNYLIFNSSALFKTIDISDINNPIELPSWEIPMEYLQYLFWNEFNSVKMGNYLYMGTIDNGIIKLSFQDGEYQAINQTMPYPRLQGYSAINRNYLLVNSISPGIRIYDISNPTSPEYLFTILDDIESYGFAYYVYDNTLLAILVDYPSSLSFVKYDITDIQDPEFIFNYTLDYLQKYVRNPNEPNILYLLNQNPDNSISIRKIDLNQNSPTEIYNYTFDYNHSFTLKWQYCFFDRGVLYFYDPIVHKFMIIDGLEDNNAEYLGLSENTFSYRNIFFDKNSHFLSIQQNGNNYLKLFKLDQNHTFEYKYKIDTDYEFVGGLFFKDNYLLLNFRYSKAAYNTTNVGTGGLLTQEFFLPSNSAKRIFITFQRNENEYLYDFQAECLSIYSIDSSGIQDNTISSVFKHITNYPNPFNPSTTISFNLQKAGKDTKIAIYNLKGQKVRELKLSNAKIGENKIIWNGKDDSGKKVASGVYLYSLIQDGKMLKTKKMVMVK